MSNKYNLINPNIQGTFNTTITAKNSVDAGQQFYKSLSEHFNNAIPKFHFTIQKGGSGKGKMYHFLIQEARNKEKVSFTLEPYEDIDNSAINRLPKRLNELKDKISQIGGKKNKSKKAKKHNDNSESSSDSDSESESDLDSDDYKRINTIIPTINLPIYYWWYDPSIYKLDTYYIPTFYTTPVIQIVI